MTLESRENKVRYVAGGGITTFPIPFRVDKAEHIQCWMADNKGQETLMTSGYSVEGLSRGEAHLVLDEFIPVGHSLTIVRMVPLAQSLSIEDGSAYHASAQMQALDTVYMALQQLDEQMARSIKVALSDAQTPDNLRDAIFSAANRAEAGAASADQSCEEIARIACVVSENANKSGMEAARAETEASRAEGYADKVQADIEGLDAHIEAAGDTQVARVLAEGDRQTGRAAAEADRAASVLPAPGPDDVGKALVVGDTGAFGLKSVTVDIVSGLRDYHAGSIQYWPSTIIPILSDGLPMGLPLDGAPVSLDVYPRLARVLCPTNIQDWAPAWYRCTASGARDAGGSCIRLDDWRGGYPQILDSGRGMAQATVLMKTTAGSKDITVVNNLSQGGTLLVPLVSADGLCPGMAVSGTGIPAGATIVAVNGTIVNLSLAATATAGSVETIIKGNQLGTWQGDAGRRFYGGTSSSPQLGWHGLSGVFYSGGLAYKHANSSYDANILMLDVARSIPTAPKNRPAGPVTNAIILV